MIVLYKPPSISLTELDGLRPLSSFRNRSAWGARAEGSEIRPSCLNQPVGAATNDQLRLAEKIILPLDFSPALPNWRPILPGIGEYRKNWSKQSEAASRLRAVRSRVNSLGSVQRAPSNKVACGHLLRCEVGTPTIEGCRGLSWCHRSVPSLQVDGAARFTTGTNDFRNGY